MMTFIPPRLREPAMYALAGVLFSAAWLVLGGHLWWVSIMAVIDTAAVVVRLYRLGGTDTDEGARARSGADERQRLISLRSRALACNLAGHIVHRPDGRDRGQRDLVLAVPGHPPHHRLQIPVRPGQLRCRRRGYAR